jgi:hypothetical protein
MQKLRRENQRLIEEVRKAAIVIDAPKKWVLCWGGRCRRKIPRSDPDGRGRPSRPTVGIVAACDCLAVPRASFYRQCPVLSPSASSVPEPATPAERRLPVAPSVRCV